MLKDIECRIHDRGAVKFPPLLAKSHESIMVPVDPYDEKNSKETSKPDPCVREDSNKSESSYENDDNGYSRKFVQEALEKKLKLANENQKAKSSKNKKYKEKKMPKNYINDNSQFYVTDPDCDNHEKKVIQPLHTKPVHNKTSKSKSQKSLKSQSISRNLEPIVGSNYNYEVSHHVPHQTPRPFSVAQNLPYPTLKPVEYHPTIATYPHTYPKSHLHHPLTSNTYYKNTPIKVQHSYHPLTVHQPWQHNYNPTYKGPYALPTRQTYHPAVISYHSHPFHVSYGTYHTAHHPKPTEEIESKTEHKKSQDENESEEQSESGEKHSETDVGSEEEKHNTSNHGEEELEKRVKSTQSKYHKKNGSDESGESGEVQDEEYSDEYEDSERYSDSTGEEADGQSSESAPPSTYTSYSSSSSSDSPSTSSSSSEGFSGFDSDFFKSFDSYDSDSSAGEHTSGEKTYSDSGENQDDENTDEEEEYDREYSYESSESQDSPKRIVYHERIVSKPTITKPLKKPKTKHSENLTQSQRKPRNSNTTKPETIQAAESETKGNTGNQDLKYFQ